LYVAEIDRDGGMQGTLLGSARDLSNRQIETNIQKSTTATVEIAVSNAATIAADNVDIDLERKTRAAPFVVEAGADVFNPSSQVPEQVVVNVEQQLRDAAERHSLGAAWGELNTEQRDRDLAEICKALTPEQSERLMRDVYAKSFDQHYHTHRENMAWYEKGWADAKSMFNSVSDFLADAVKGVRNLASNVAETASKVYENGAKIVSYVGALLSKVTAEQVMSAAAWVGNAAYKAAAGVVNYVVEATGLPSLYRAGEAALSGNFGQALTELQNAVKAPVKAVIGLGKVVYNTAEALGVGEIVRGVGCLACGDISGARQALKGAWTLFVETTGLADAYKFVSYGAQALYAGLIKGDFKAAALLGAQSLMHGAFAAISAGAIVATVATAGAAAPAVLAAVGLRQFAKTAAKEVVEAGLEQVVKEGLEQLGKKIGADVLAEGLEAKAKEVGKNLGKTAIEEITQKLARDMTPEAAKKLAEEVVQRQTAEVVRKMVSEQVAKSTVRVLGGDGLETALKQLTQEGILNPQAAKQIGDLVRCGGREIAEKQLREALEKGIKETIEKPVTAALKEGFEGSFAQGLKNLRNLGYADEVIEAVGRGGREGLERGIKEGLEKGIREGVEAGLKAVRARKMGFITDGGGTLRGVRMQGNDPGGAEVPEELKLTKHESAGSSSTGSGSRRLAPIFGPDGAVVGYQYVDGN
jgi:hypothetical protein